MNDTLELSKNSKGLMTFYINYIMMNTNKKNNVCLKYKCYASITQVY